MDCTHPQSENAFDAEEALAYSCNSYFAEMAKRFTPEEAVNALGSYGVPAIRRYKNIGKHTTDAVARPGPRGCLRDAVAGG